MLETVRLMVSYDDWNDVEHYRKFEVIEKLPGVGDYWHGTGMEVIRVRPFRLDIAASSKYSAYAVEYINIDCEDEKDDPFIDYVAIKY